MLLSEAMVDIRSILQDEQTPYRYPDATVRAGLNDGLATAYSMRPDLFIGAFASGPPRVTASTGELPLEPMYQSALVRYAAGWCELRDDEFTTDGRATVLRNEFVARLRGAA